MRGTDVVSYLQPGGPVKGQAAWRHDFDGTRYLFSSAQNKAAFVADPDRWLPQFDGLCTAWLNKGFIGQSDPMMWKIVGGKLYLFSTAGRMPTDAQAAETLARARENWGKEVAGWAKACAAIALRMNRVRRVLLEYEPFDGHQMQRPLSHGLVLPGPRAAHSRTFSPTRSVGTS